MNVKYRAMEDILMVALAIPTEGRSALSARIKRFIGLGLLAAGNVGKGRKATYGLQDVLDAALALTMARSHLPAPLIVEFIDVNRTSLQALWTEARDKIAGERTLVLRADAMADPAAVVRNGGRGSLLAGMEMRGPWDSVDDRPLASIAIDLSLILRRVADAMRAVRVARLVVVNKSLSDDEIDAAFDALSRQTR